MTSAVHREGVSVDLLSACTAAPRITHGIWFSMGDCEIWTGLGSWRNEDMTWPWGSPKGWRREGGCKMERKQGPWLWGGGCGNGLVELRLVCFERLVRWCFIIILKLTIFSTTYSPVSKSCLECYSLSQIMSTISVHFQTGIGASSDYFAV